MAYNQRMVNNKVNKDEIPENAIPVKFHVEYEPHGIKMIFEDIQYLGNEDQLYYVYENGQIIEVYIVRKEPDHGMD